MKILLILLLCAFSMPAVAQMQLQQVTPKAIQTLNVPGRYRTLITMSLKSYSEVQIMGFTKTDVTFTHSAGMETAKLNDMPSEIQMACNFTALTSAGTSSTAQPAAPTPEQIEAVRRTETRRYIKVISEDGDGALCHVWGIGGSRDPRVAALRKAGWKLREYKNEFLFPLHETNKYLPGHEFGLVKGLQRSNGEEEMVVSLYLVKNGVGAKHYVYATSLTEAAKLLAGQ